MPVSYRYVNPEIGHGRRVPLITAVSFSRFHFFPSMKETHFMATAVEVQCSQNFFKSTLHKEWYIGWCTSTRIQDTKKVMNDKLEKYNRPKQTKNNRKSKQTKNNRKSKQTKNNRKSKQTYKPKNGVSEYLYSTETNNMNAIPRKIRT